MTHPEIIGWDIGGAHLKVAHINARGDVLSAEQIPAPLWQGRRVLADALAAITRTLPSHNVLHAVTTTAELVDIFEDRQTGIRAIAADLQQAITTQPLLFYAGDHGWVAPTHAGDHAEAIASANWHATAQFMARDIATGILVDVGSTTTDIIPVIDQQLCHRGYSDFERLQFDELVYTGIVRTPVMAVCREVVINGVRHPLVAEQFATMADVYRVTGELQADADMLTTADGAGKSLPESARRLARMLGCDLADPCNDTHWRELASAIADQQLQTMQSSLQRVLQQAAQPVHRLIGAGAGRFLVEKLADRLDLEYVDFAALNTQDETVAGRVARSAAAFSVAQLLRLDSQEEQRVWA